MHLLAAVLRWAGLTRGQGLTWYLRHPPPGAGRDRFVVVARVCDGAQAINRAGGHLGVSINDDRVVGGAGVRLQVGCIPVVCVGLQRGWGHKRTCLEAAGQLEGICGVRPRLTSTSRRSGCLLRRQRQRQRAAGSGQPAAGGRQRHRAHTHVDHCILQVAGCGQIAQCRGGDCGDAGSGESKLHGQGQAAAVHNVLQGKLLQ